MNTVPGLTEVALLRSINIGKRRLAMSDLRSWCDQAGLGVTRISLALIKVPAGKTTTARNWRTVMMLNDWARELDHD